MNNAYKYSARKGPGDYIESIVYAESKEQAMEKIVQLGYSQVSIGELVPPSSQADKRVYVRVDSKVSIKYKTFKGKIQEPDEDEFEPELLATTKNISAGGLLFYANDPLGQGEVIKLTLQLPDQNPIECLAKVVRSNKVFAKSGYDIAVYFLDLPHVERLRLNRHILN